MSHAPPASPSKSEQNDRQSGKGNEEEKQEQESGEKEGKAEPGGKGEGEQKEKGKEPFRPSKKVIVIGVIVLLVLIIGGLLWWLHARQFVSTDDAYTTGHVHEVSSRVSGIVTEVWVDDNQVVKKGDLLVVLDPRDYEAALSRAKGSLAQARAQVGTQQATLGQTKAAITEADANIEMARAQVAQSSSQLEKARLDYERVSGLYTRDLKAVAKADVETATANFESARSALEGSRAKLAASVASADSARANAAAAEAQITASEASVTSAEAAVRNAELQLSYTRIVAPEDGKVSRKTVETGRQLQPGQALLAIVPQDVWVVANLKETQLENLQVGQRVDIKIDALSHQTFYGSVHSIQEGTGATFSLLPPDNATGNFTKIVQRVPVKIVFDPESIREFRDKIVPGLSVEPHIDLSSLRDNKREPKRTEKTRKQNEKVEQDKGERS